MCVPHHIGLLWCICVTILVTPLGVCLSSPHRGNLPITQVNCPLLSPLVSTSLDLCSIRIQVSVSQALHSRICAGLRWWWVHLDGRNNVPSPMDTNPVLAKHSPISQVHRCGSPLFLVCEPQLPCFQVKIQECSAVVSPRLGVLDSTPGSKQGPPAHPDGFFSTGHSLL